MARVRGRNAGKVFHSFDRWVTQPGIVALALATSAALGGTACSNGDLASSVGHEPERPSSSKTQAIAVDPPVVIRQVYGGGGNSGAVYTNDFIELFNRGSAPQSLAGWSIQYAAATGTGTFAGPPSVLPAFTLQPGQSYLVQESLGAGGTTALPTPDLVPPSLIAMAATGGKVALVNGTTALACNGAPTACTQAQLDSIIDLVGWGGANFFEGTAAAPATTNTTSVSRAGNGCTDTNQNAADFTAGAPVPRNSASPLSPCTPSDAGPDGTGGAGGAGGTAGTGGTGGTAGTGGSGGTGGGTGGTGGTDGGVGACGSPATAIGAIQGSGSASLMTGATVVIEGVVVGDFQDNDINGFFVQEEDGGQDGDPATSDGIFVFEGALAVPVAVGDLVRVQGQVAEFSGLTELSNVTDVVACGHATASAQTLTLPVAAVTDLERYEGMLVHIAQQLTVTGNFDLGRFGSLDLSVGGRLFEPTNLVAPGAPAIALQSTNDRSRIILDDLSGAQDPNPIPYKDVNNTRRVGDQLSELTGVLDGRFSVYRIQPTVPPVFTSGNPRSATPPSVGGRLRVASFNVLNFFTTLDTGTAICGPTGGLDCRGANDANEFNRQREKLLNSIVAINADIAGLTEIENNAAAATQSLVDGLNGRFGAGTYTFVNTGTIGTDAIKVAFLYKPAKVSTVGAFALLTTAVDSRFIDTKNRPALAQTFQEVATGAKVTVVINHLKSKGSACTDVSDPDIGDGQGNCNQTRNQAAMALRDWIATDPTHSSDADFLVMGDLNSYAKEDPITTLQTAGYDQLIARFAGASAYSYQFQGQSGYLDHALASPTLSSQVTGAAEWHSNADEPVVLDYNTEFKTDDPFTLADPFRSSDHDAVVVGLNLTSPNPVPAFNGWYGAGFASLLLVLGQMVLQARSKREGGSLG